MDALDFLKQAYPEYYPTRPYGSTNPYHYCAHCRRSTIDINSKGHDEFCEWSHARKMISDLEKALESKISTQEAKLAVAILNHCSEILGRNICNELPRNISELLTQEEWDVLNKKYHEYNGDPEEYRLGAPPIHDYALAAFLAHRMKSLLPGV